jgi:hypothetical protein
VKTSRSIAYLIRDYDCLNDEEDCTGVDLGVNVVEPGVAACPCGRRREARVGRVTLPIFAPGFKGGDRASG